MSERREGRSKRPKELGLLDEIRDFLYVDQIRKTLTIPDPTPEQRDRILQSIIDSWRRQP